MPYTWYALIDVSANGLPTTSGNGTSASPFSWNGLQRLLNHSNPAVGPGGQLSSIGDGDTVKIRGYYHTPADITFIPTSILEYSATDVTFESWDPEVYGYWKIKSDYGVVNLFPNHAWDRYTSAVFKDLVTKDIDIGTNTPLYTSDFLRLNLDFINCIIYGDTDFRIANVVTPVHFLGTTFVNGTFFADDLYYGETSAAGLSAIFDDCSFINTNFQLSQTSGDLTRVISADYIFNNSIFEGTSADVFVVSGDRIHLNDCTFEWIPAVAFPNLEDISISNKSNLLYQQYGANYSIMTRRGIWISNNYNTGSYNSIRKGPGSFYFTEPIYVDFSASEGSGVSASPLNFNQFSAYSNSYDSSINGDFKTSGIYNQDSFLIKGICACDNFNFMYPGGSGYLTQPIIYLSAWNPRINGPFRILATSAMNLGYTYSSATGKFQICDGLLYSPTINIYGSLSANTVFTSAKEIYSQNCSGSPDPNSYFVGSTIITLSGINVNESSAANELIFQDSVFVGTISNRLSGSNEQYETSAKFYDCVLTVETSTDISAVDDLNLGIKSLTVSGNQYNWTAPTWPNYNAQLSAFTYTNLGQGITISGSRNW